MQIFQDNLSKVMALMLNRENGCSSHLQQKKMLLVLPKTQDVGTKISFRGVHHNVLPIRVL